MTGSPIADAAGTEARSAAEFLDALDVAAERHGTTTVACTFRCSSGDRFVGEWRGVRVGDLLADAPPETTHVRAVSADGYHAPVAIRDALDAIVATERLDSEPDGLPRLVGGDVPGPRTVRNLIRIEPIALPAGADAEPGNVEELDGSRRPDTTTVDDDRPGSREASG